MKHFMNAIFTLCFIWMPVLAFAAPVPASYNDDAWRTFIEKQDFSKLPKGIPNGKAPVTRYHDSGFWPEDYIYIQKPYDLSQMDGIIYSDEAMKYKRYYASETMKLFLESTLTTFRKITGNKKISIPVYVLFFNEDLIPVKALANDISDIEFGVFLPGDNGIVADANQTMLHDYAAKILHPYINEQYIRIQNRVSESKEDFKKMKPEVFTNIVTSLVMETREDIKEDRSMEKFSKNAQKDADRVLHEEEIREKQKAKMDAHRAALKEKRKAITENPELVALNQRIDELTGELKDADRDDRQEIREELKELRQKRRDLRNRLNDEAQIAQKKDINTRHSNSPVKKKSNMNISANVNFLTRLSNLVDAHNEYAEAVKANWQDLNADNRFDKVREKHRKTQLQVRPMAIKTSYKTPMNQDKYVDIRTTWDLVEAILTQDAVYVSEIRMTPALKLRLIDHAKMNGKSEELVQKLNDKVSLTMRGFGVSLGCSLRDRFLGCKLGSDDAFEKQVSTISGAILKHLNKVPLKRKFELIQLVVDANPVEVIPNYDITALAKEMSEAKISDSEFEIYKSQLNELSKIRGVNGSLMKALSAKSKQDSKKKTSKSAPKRRIKDGDVDLPK